MLRVTSEGKDGTVDHFLYDEYDEETKTHSMARVTGLPVIMMAELIAAEKLKRPGVNTPEVLGQDPELFNLVCAALRTNGIKLTEKINISTSSPQTSAVYNDI